jgi:hypothetical protein
LLQKNCPLQSIHSKDTLWSAVVPLFTLKSASFTDALCLAD